MDAHYRILIGVNSPSSLSRVLSERRMSSSATRLLQPSPIEPQIQESGTYGQSLLSAPLRKETVVSVILPVHNESKTIRETVRRYYQELDGKLPFELIVAEDGSIDGTREILMSLKEEIPIVLLSDQNRKGYARGVSDAIKCCCGEWIFFSDADGQFSPADFWRLWEVRERFDMVVGTKLRRRDAWYRIILSKGFRALVNITFKLSLKDSDSGFRLIRRGVAQSVIGDVKFLKYSFWIEFTVRANLMGFKVLDVKVGHHSRPFGDSQILRPPKIPTVVPTQLTGLLHMYLDTRSIRQRRPVDTSGSIRTV